jgi:hypothetical protein
VTLGGINPPSSLYVVACPDGVTSPYAYLEAGPALAEADRRNGPGVCPGCRGPHRVVRYRPEVLVPKAGA